MNSMEEQTDKEKENNLNRTRKSKKKEDESKLTVHKDPRHLQEQEDAPKYR